MFLNFSQANFDRFDGNLSSTYIPDKNTRNITYVFLGTDSILNDLTFIGNLFIDTLTINSHKINNTQIIKAFAFYDRSQPDVNGLPFSVDNVILIFC